MLQPIIREAVPADAPAWAERAEAWFRETFGHRNDPIQVERYCATSFGADIQAAEIEEPGRLTLFVVESEEIIGFAHIKLESEPEGIELLGPLMEIQRFYLARAYHGTGLAQRFMTHCFEEARKRGKSAVWLAVWKEHPRGIAFYRKMGFEIVGEQNFMLGTEVQYDWVMVRKLEP
jgi:ribosomal protein S18 acetylase RimI-like enzyme